MTEHIFFIIATVLILIIVFILKHFIGQKKTVKCIFIYVTMSVIFSPILIITKLSLAKFFSPKSHCC